MAKQTTWQCDACDYEVSSTTKRDLDTDGWRFHTIKGARVFTMCPECETRYAKVWDAKPKATA